MNPIATITIEQAVTRFILKNKRSIDNYSTYLEHACELIQGFKTLDANQAALGLSITTDSYVPLFMNEMIASYLLYKESISNPQQAEQVQAYEKNFLNEKRKAQVIFNNLSDT
jgi:hypothetical protein